MTIALCGSIKFFDQLQQVRQELESLGHQVFMPIKVPGVDYWSIDNTDRVVAKQGMDLIGEHYRKIEQSDAIVVVNCTKQDQEYYIGANTFAEMVFAHYKGKAIFALYPLPNQPYIHDELQSMAVTALNGDLSLLR